MKARPVTPLLPSDFLSLRRAGASIIQSDYTKFVRRERKNKSVRSSSIHLVRLANQGQSI